MKSILRLALAVTLLMPVGTMTAAFEETLSGTLVCAKCALNKPDAHECQDVLIVTDTAGTRIEYYITKNDVAEKSGEACTLEIKATVTGTVSERDGRKWLTASKIEKH
jgi:hypothetical protein